MIYIAGVVVLLVAFAAGLSIARKGGHKDPLAGTAQPAAAQSTAQPTSEELQYEVFVAAFGGLQKAKQMEAELKNRKYHSAHVKMPSAGDTLYKVFIGPYTRKEADRVSDELYREGARGHIVIEAKQE
jgi:cell division septation protein DedD